jgi:hypothetical protein
MYRVVGNEEPPAKRIRIFLICIAGHSNGLPYNKEWGVRRTGNPGFASLIHRIAITCKTEREKIAPTLQKTVC